VRSGDGEEGRRALLGKEDLEASYLQEEEEEEGRMQAGHHP